MADGELSDFERGPLLEDGSFMFNQERLERDFELTQVVQAGYTPPIPTHENPRPRIVDGVIDEAASEALGVLWEAYEPAINKAAHKHARRAVSIPALDYDDFVQVGFDALYHSAVRWHPKKRITFLTHLDALLGHFMNRHIQNYSRNVRIPIDARQNVDKVNKITWQIYQEDKHTPTREHVAKALGKNTAEVDFLVASLALADEMGSINGGFFDDDRDRHSVYGRQTAAQWHPIDPSASVEREVDNQVIADEMARIIRESVEDGGGVLNEKQVAVLTLRYLDGRYTLQDIADAWGVTREAIRQTEARALAKLRAPNPNNRFRQLLENQD